MTLGIKSKHDLDPTFGWDGILSAVGFAMRATVHTTTRATPSQLAFGRDAINNTAYVADWQYIKQRKQHVIRQNNRRENAKRIPYHYSINDRVMIKQENARKYDGDAYKGPFTVVRVNDNGTVLLARSTPSGGVVHETWNIRSLYPYKV